MFDDGPPISIRDSDKWSLMNQSNEFDDFAKDYQGHINEALGPLGGDVAYYVGRKVQILRKLISDQSVERVLDYGCGIGQAVPFLKNAFNPAILIGSDLSSASVDFAIRQYPYLLYRHPEELEDNSFDLIFVSNVMHHIDPTERSKVVQDLCKKLRPGGKIAIFEHNPFNFVTRIVVSKCVFDEGVQLLSKSQVRQVLRSTGLIENLKSGYCLFVPERFRKLNWLEDKLGLVPLGGQHFTIGSKKLNQSDLMSVHEHDN